MKRIKMLGFMSLMIAIVIVSSVILSASAGLLGPILNEEQKDELKELREEFREETIGALLSDYGIVLEEGEKPRILKDRIDALTDEERSELFESMNELKEEFRENVIQPKLEEWDITLLNEEQKDELKELREEFREETIGALLSDYGIVLEEGEKPRILKDRIDALTDEERSELFESMNELKEEFRENVIQPKLEEWDITLPEFGEGNKKSPFKGRCPGGPGMGETESA